MSRRGISARGYTTICPECEGKGRVYDHALGIFTFGWGYLLQTLDPIGKDICPLCNGEKFITLE